MVAIAPVHSERQKVPPEGNTPLKTWCMHVDTQKHRVHGVCSEKVLHGLFVHKCVNPAIKAAHGVPRVSTVSLTLWGVLDLVYECGAFIGGCVAALM